MQKLTTLLALLIITISLFLSCQQKETKKAKPKIAIAGLAIESSTFSPAKTEEAAFHARYKDGMGQLCAFDMVNRDLYFQVNIE